MEFKEFSKIINKKFMDMCKGDLFVVQQERNTIWDVYLESYPEGTNEIYKERREHDCQNCKQFIRNIGGVVNITDGLVDTIWNVEGLEDEYAIVASALHEFVKGLPIQSIFLKQEHSYGLLSNIQITPVGNIVWDHFHADVPSKFYNKFPDTVIGEIRTNKELLERGCIELTQDALETTLELINQDGIYRGAEHKGAVEKFLKLYKAYAKATDKNTWLWANAKDPTVRFKNTVIGTLIQDISEGVELDRAVASFESKVAPSNYKRTTSVITQGMVDKALDTINTLGIEPSLHRRFAKLSDISVNNVLFADRSSMVVMKDTVTDLLTTEVKRNKKVSGKIDEVSIEDFITNVLPTTQSIEMMFEGKHQSNLCSLIAPVYGDSPNILKWSNNFSWAYRGGVTDSIKEMVKSAGGNVEGAFRISLTWTNNDDLDLHCVEPSGEEIYFSHKLSRTRGQLDIDMTHGGTPEKPCVENIFWVKQSDMQKGSYKIRVHNFSKRESTNQGYTIEIDFNGDIHQFSSKGNPSNGSTDAVVTVSYDGTSITVRDINQKLTHGSISKNVWGIDTNQFHKVSLVSLSPNFWDDNHAGNKHYMFLLDDCKNDESTIGLYNEFLDNALTPHRKVFECLGSKMRVPESSEQLSGLGFSSTKRDSVTVKVTGAFTRVLKINF